MDLDRFHGKSGREERKILFLELNYLIPSCLKEAGYEIIRHEEIAGVSMSMIRKIARSIHSRYLHEIRKDSDHAAIEKGIAISEFDDLPAELQLSNMDNASHIPTKLLSIGYKIRPVKKGFKSPALHLDDDEIETMAKVEHLRWSWEKRLNGWAFGKTKDAGKKIHPSLIKYDELDENEKEKDRELVRLIPAILKDINYEAYPVSSGLVNKLSYAIKPRSSIHKLLYETTELNEEIRGLASSSPVISEKIRSIDEKIRLTIGEVQGSYNYARHIQDAFLPEDLYIRECFPDSFVLYEPKDIVSGDIYLFSKQDDHIIFALADCTGHGIPAALISTIGYGILDQAVNIIRITDPAEVLRYLYSGVHRFLRRHPEENGVSDDMDIVLCNLDSRSRILTYSGTGNILWHVTDGKITEIRSGTNRERTGDNEEYNFVTGRLQMEAGDVLYLCSDGYADQFGGSSHKRYSRKRLSEFLLQVHASPMPEQGDRLYEEFDLWREEKDEDQTDDITIIGIRI
jgi:serine phosphatase RsbU (regulator of sigma subunit)